ncbi:putative cation-transporting ATPase V [Anopheles sinensis]|uniref:Putative cation-transporting ATPase V n=1 Tax=Anopheles sinensis TaxID=74873 RepID=A0A084VCL1_ANOSI|nr:putative cation-transporting ATPase V [Anopheles sinensis]
MLTRTSAVFLQDNSIIIVHHPQIGEAGINKRCGYSQTPPHKPMLQAPSGTSAIVRHKSGQKLRNPFRKVLGGTGGQNKNQRKIKPNKKRLLATCTQLPGRVLLSTPRGKQSWESFGSVPSCRRRRGASGSTIDNQWQNSQVDPKGRVVGGWKVSKFEATPDKPVPESPPTQHDNSKRATTGNNTIRSGQQQHRTTLQLEVWPCKLVFGTGTQKVCRRSKSIS